MENFLLSLDSLRRNLLTEGIPSVSGSSERISDNLPEGYHLEGNSSVSRSCRRILFCQWIFQNDTLLSGKSSRTSFSTKIYNAKDSAKRIYFCIYEDYDKLYKPVFKILLHTLFWKVSETEGILNLIYLSMAPTLPNVMLLYMKLWTCSGITREGMKAGTSLEMVLLKSSNTMMDIQRFFTGFLTRKTICHSWTNISKYKYVGCFEQID